MSIDVQAASRRKFLQFLAASPLLAASDLAAFANESPNRLPDPMVWSPRNLDRLIKDPKEALNVFDFEPVMAKNVPPAHFGYMATGIDDEQTLRANREGFQKFVLRPRRLVNVSKPDTSVELFGHEYASPVGICPTGSQRAYHPDGEVAVARAAQARQSLDDLVQPVLASVEDATKARGAPIWFQLYATNNYEIAAHHVHRAEHARLRGGGGDGRPQRRTQHRNRTAAPAHDTRQCTERHDRSSLATNLKKRPRTRASISPGMTEYPLLGHELGLHQAAARDITKMKMVIKGIITWEDAELARKNEIDAVIVSNHGGRAEDGGPSTIESLPEIIAVADDMPVLINPGFRRGSDIVKALCMGARAVCVGRPYLWGLGAFGQPGVERVLELLRIETRAQMQQMGAPTLKHLVPAMVRRA